MRCRCRDVDLKTVKVTVWVKMLCNKKTDETHREKSCTTTVIVYLWFFHDLDEKHVVLHRVDDNQHVSKVGWDDSTSVVPSVFWPHYMHLVISQVT